MSDIINFSDRKYLEILKALEEKNGNGDVCEFTSVQAFFYLLNIRDDENKIESKKEFPNLRRGDMDNLILAIQLNYKNKYGKEYSLDECFKRLQGKVELTYEEQKEILDIAYGIIDSGKTLGNRITPDGRFNTSGWLSHSLYVARFSRVIAEEINKKQGMNLDVDKIQALAVLHDFGRKKNHTFGHVIQGAEFLIDDGKSYSAVAAVMHSFLAGKRCSNNERALPGFYMDENGNEAWIEGSETDDIRDYLATHNLTMGDLILNLGDLVATEKGVVKLSDRLNDIATRRELDPQNREYFLLQVIKSMTYILSKMQVEIPKEVLKEFPRPGDGVPKANTAISKLSDILYLYYENLIGKSPKSTDDNDDGNR